MSKSFYNNEEIHTLVVIPPDGGWGWLVVFCSFMCNFVIDGNVYSYGIFVDYISNEFDTQIYQTVLVGSIMVGLSYMVGPFVSALINRYDFRVIAVVGCCISGAGYALAAFSLNYYMFLVSYGIVLGTGLGMLYVPAIIISGIYFVKLRALAFGIATCGSGFGTLIMPQIISLLLTNLGWRMALLIMNSFILLAALCALTFRPLEPENIVSKREQDINIGTSTIELFEKDKRKYCTCCQHSNKYYPIATEVVPFKDATTEDIDIRSTITSQMSYRNTRLLSTLSYQFERFNYCWFNCLTCLCMSCWQPSSRPMYRDDVFYNHSINLIPAARRAMKMQTKLYRKNRRKERRKQIAAAQTSRAPDIRKEDIIVEEDDKNFKEYNMNVTRVTTNRELYDTLKPCCACHIAGIRALTTMLDFHLMKSIAFLIFGLSGMFFTLGYMIPFMFIYERAIEFGIDEELSVWLLSIIGGANTIGRIMSGVLPCVMEVNSIYFISFTVLISGLMTACSGFTTMLWFQISYCCCYGILCAPSTTLKAVVVVEIFGLENLTNCFGLQLLFSGITAMCGPTLAGFLRDVTEDYQYSFFFAGACLVLSGLLILIVKPIRNWEIRTAFTNF